MAEERGTRRTILKAGLAAALALPWRFGEAIARLGRDEPRGGLPRTALVLGIAEYRTAPALVNSVNDARAMAGQLKAAGFEVELRVDATRVQMVESIDSYAARLAATRGVGLFYFSGHGLQLAWRNYLLPVDAAVTRAEDVPEQGVDLGRVLDGVKRAANAMNLVIVDACRDNPFGTTAGIAAKGLSQIDAPPGTLLAYATSPGNTASDGAGVNGLYTEHLLREMQARDAKIEDVFKRVRLGVRRQSRGAQIPWESTSLEHDFYFVRPDNVDKRLADDALDSAFQEELALFEAARDAKASAPLLEYLRRHPSGRFAELAQLQLEHVLAAEGEKRIHPASAAGNPYTAGSLPADTAYRVGDRYSYRVKDRLSGAVREVRLAVTAINDTEVHCNGGRVIFDPLGNSILTGDGRRFTARQDQPVEFAVGKRWTTRFRTARNGADLGFTTLEFRVTARERVSVPAGDFDCFRVEGVRLDQDDFTRQPPRIETRLTYWAAPDRVRRPVAAEEETWKGKAGNMILTVRERRELFSFAQS